MRKIKVGLALGAGAAKGWAHIGVINALQKMDIEIDIVAGCSVGALVGAAFASQRLSVMEEWVRSFSYWDVIKLMDLSWHGGGLLRGDRVFNVIGKLLKINDFSDCTRKFGAVVTNISTDRELWMTQGDINQAIRASCSMPGLLAPVWFEGYWLVDGALTNPVPISLARAMGADIVIAVDLQDDTHLIRHNLLSEHSEDDEINNAAARSWRSRLRDRLNKVTVKKTKLTPTAMEIMSSSIHILENRVKRTRMASDPADILIQPYCPQISTLDFHRASEAINAGWIAVEKQIDTLNNLIQNGQ